MLPTTSDLRGEWLSVRVECLAQSQLVWSAGILHLSEKQCEMRKWSGEVTCYQPRLWILIWFWEVIAVVYVWVRHTCYCIIVTDVCRATRSWGGVRVDYVEHLTLCPTDIVDRTCMQWPVGLDPLYYTYRIMYSWSVVEHTTTVSTRRLWKPLFRLIKFQLSFLLIVLIMLSQNNVGVYFVGKYRMCL